MIVGGLDLNDSTVKQFIGEQSLIIDIQSGEIARLRSQIQNMEQALADVTTQRNEMMADIANGRLVSPDKQ